MIEILGHNEGREYEAALKLRELLIESWDFVERDQQSKIKILAGVQCHGQSPRDIDLVLLGTLSERYVFSPFLSFYDKRGTNHEPARVRVRDLCLVIEVKDHDLSGVQWTGTQLKVRYGNKWSDATHQSEGQKYSLKNYLAHNRLTPPYIINLIWLQNIRNSDLPPRPHNVLGSNSSWDLFLNVVMQLTTPQRHGEDYTIASSEEFRGGITQAIGLLTKRIEPTRLDREKMDRICRSAVKPEWLETIGVQQLTFYGRGGAGKTVILLRLAWQLYEDQKDRVLLLTYNKALVSDLRRLFTLMNLSDGAGGNALQIQTVHSFFRQMLLGLDIINVEALFLENYSSFLDEALNFLEGGAITEEDISELFASNPALDWKFVFVDEAQDWYEAERDILRILYGSNRLALADGGDQLVRRNTACNWNHGLSENERKKIVLKKCLRMKAGLARFVTVFAREIGVDWSTEPNIDAPGGRVVIIDGDYFADIELHKNFFAANEADGNSIIDSLMCIPPSLVEKDPQNKTSISIPGRTLNQFGFEVWDGADLDTRAGYPTSVNQLRIVQYESCRGLEGWIVVNLALDDFYKYKLNSWTASPQGEEVLFDDQLAANRFAARWVMIPLTRAIDTLVVQIGPGPSPVRDALQKAADFCRDSVTWQRV